MQSAEPGEVSRQAQGWTPDASMRVRGVSQVRVSPDGQRVAYTVREAVMTDDMSEYVTQVHLAQADGGDTYPITFDAASSNDPQWSPDGKWLAFLSKRGEKDKAKTNLYILRVSGGEAERITDVKGDIAAFAWSPNGSHIVFAMPDTPDEAEEKRGKGKDDWRWVDEDVKNTRLHVTDVYKDGKGKREPRALTPPDVNVWVPGGFDWSPDGHSVAFTHTKSPSWDDWVTSDISVVRVEDGIVSPLVAGSAASSQPKYAPEGDFIAFTLSDDPVGWPGANRIHVVAAGGGSPRPLGETFDGNATLIGWGGDGKTLYCVEPRGTRTGLYALDPRLEAVTQVNTGGGGLIADISLNAAGTHFGFARQTSIRPVEAFVSPANDFAPTQVSRVNDKLPALPLGATEIIRWQSKDGLEIEGLLTYPVGYEAAQNNGRRIPLLLIVHGGPSGVFLENFIGSPSLYPVATFAAMGYATLRANPRGSSGYGKTFRYANKNDWGGGDYNDLMAGVDHVIGMGVADADRLGVMGWSYGGFMTSWIITHTPRFKAASVGAAVTNLISFTGTADIPGFLPDYFGGQFWDVEATYRAHSPMFHVRGVTTPSLIQHGDADIRVPISQGYEFYNALKAQGVPVRMLVLPRQPHSPNEPKMQLKTMQTNVEWFGQHIKTE